MTAERKKAAKKTASKQGAKLGPRSYPTGFLTVGQTARILGVSTSTLRVWENVGLVTPARSHGRFRLYTTEMLELLKRIKYLRDVEQLSVPGIKHLLEGAAEAKLKTKKTKTAGEPPPAKPASPGSQVAIGLRLRRLRKRTGMGIVEAARMARISPSFLSAVELSHANASIATLQRLASTYGSTVMDFYDLPKRASRLLRPQDRIALRTDTPVKMEVLSVGTKSLQCMMFTVPPRAGSDGAYAHEGEEFLYVLSGAIEFWLDEAVCHILHQGDSFWFESNVGHRFLNPFEKDAVLLWINTPITF